MRFLVLGSGAQGSIIAGHLVKEDDVDAVICADISQSAAEGLVKKLRSPKARALKVDAGKAEEVAKAAEGVDVVVNATIPKFNFTIMEACLKAGANYMDLAAGPIGRRLAVELLDEQLKLNDLWKDAGLTALVSTGASPGLTSVLARHAADQLTTVESVKIRFGDRTVSEELVIDWSPRVMLEELFLVPPVVYQDGEIRRLPLFSGAEVYPFPEPIGPQKVFLVEHEEVLSIPRFIGKGIRYVDVKGSLMGDIEPVRTFFIWLSQVLDKPVNIKGVNITLEEVLLSLMPEPTDLRSLYEKGLIKDAYSTMIIEVEGKKGKRKVKQTFQVTLSLSQALSLMPWSNEVSYVTGTPAAVMALMLGRGQVKLKGVITTELLDPEPVIRGVVERGIPILFRVEEEGEMP